MSTVVSVAPPPVFYKALAADLDSPYGRRLAWELPTQAPDGTWTPGAWQTTTGAIVLCGNGIHACERKDVPTWLNARIFTLEYASVAPGDFLDGGDKVVGRQARLTSETRWNAQRARHFAADCAAYVVALYEAQVPGDSRVRDAIAITRLFADGQATREELSAARSAAESAAESAAWSAARSAAGSAAGSAARSAAGSAAWSAAESAAESAARTWQADRLALYLHDAALPTPYVAAESRAV